MKQLDKQYLSLQFKVKVLLKNGTDYSLKIKDKYAKQAIRELYFPIGSDRRIISGESGAAGYAGFVVLINGVLRIVIFPIFGAIGGIIGVELLKDKEEPKVEYQAEDVVEEDVVEEDVIEEEK